MLYSRISSGLDFLDAAIGGLYSNRCYLLRGPGQSGRTTISLQFLLDGLDNDESAMMISSDRIENVILKSEAMGLSLESFLMENRLILMEYPKEIMGSNFQFSHIINLLGEIEQYLQHYNCTRLVFDTLIPLLSKQQGPHLVNYIYSLINSLEELNVTTIVTTGEPNSPAAQRITQLIEDAVVGSFALSNISTLQGQQRSFAIHKMVDPIKPPTSFKVAIDYGSGVVLDQPKMASDANQANAGFEAKDLLSLPMQIALFDNDEENLNHLEEIFHDESQIAVFDSEEEFMLQTSDMDFDFILINANMPNLNWQSTLSEIIDQFPKLPKFILSGRRNAAQINQVARQAGADGMFINPIDPNDLVGALAKALKKYGTFESVITKRRAFLTTSDIPDDLSDSSGGLGTGIADVINLQTPQAFREKLYRQVWRSRHQELNFSLISFKMVYTTSNAQREHMQQGLELVKKIAMIVHTSLRGLNDSACRYMDKVVVLLENSDKEGARAFARRVSKELKTELQTKLNLQVGKHLNILTAIVTYPEDGAVGDELMHQVTDISRNFVKSII